MPYDDGPEDERCSECGRLDPINCPCPEENTVTYPHTEDVVLMLATPETITSVTDVADERVRQVEKWGVQTRPNGTSLGYAGAAAAAKFNTHAKAADGTLTWVDILMEEVFEALAETDPTRLREEMVQVAAVAVAIIEDIDRKASGA
jgi:hypothetical protein